MLPLPAGVKVEGQEITSPLFALEKITNTTQPAVNVSFLRSSESVMTIGQAPGQYG